MDTATPQIEGNEPPMNPDEMGMAAPVGDLDFTTGWDDYWGTDETFRHMLPDGRQYIEIKLMAEGERARFEKDNNQDLRVSREGDTTIKVDPGRMRKALLKAAICDWFIVRKHPQTGKVGPFQFSDANLNLWIDAANPKIIDGIEKAIREFNPWLKNDLTVEEIDKEIESLQNEKEKLLKRDAGE